MVVCELVVGGGECGGGGDGGYYGGWGCVTMGVVVGELVGWGWVNMRACASICRLCARA